MDIAFLQRKKMTRDEMILMFTSLSYMQSAGLTLRDGVDLLLSSKDTKLNPYGLNVMKDAFNAGLKLSEIFKENESIYGQGMWRQIDAAERTGKVPSCLTRIAGQLKNSRGISSKIRGALMYPTFILAVALIAGYYLFTTTIPNMAEMMAEFDAELPAITLAVLSMSRFMIALGPLVAVLVIGAISGIVYILRGPARVQWHTFLTKFPISAKVSINVNYSLAYTLINDMIENGSSMVEALRVAAYSLSNKFISNQLLASADAMFTEGLGLSGSLVSATSLPSDDKMLLIIGSKTGRERELLIEMSERRKVVAEESVQRLLEMMTPIIMVLVCLIVGLMVISVYLPMITMATNIS